MKQAKPGDKVKIHFTGKLENGGVFADSTAGEPLEFKIGNSKVITGIQDAVIGMTLAQKKVVEVPPEKGFGLHQKELIKEVGKAELPANIEYEKGKTVRLPLVNGEKADARVVDVSDSTVTLDLNHPLAAQKLVFEISLLEIL